MLGRRGEPHPVVAIEGDDVPEKAEAFANGDAKVRSFEVERFSVRIPTHARVRERGQVTSGRPGAAARKEHAPFDDEKGAFERLHRRIELIAGGNGAERPVAREINGVIRNWIGSTLAILGTG